MAFTTSDAARADPRDDGWIVLLASPWFTGGSRGEGGAEGGEAAARSALRSRLVALAPAAQGGGGGAAGSAFFRVSTAASAAACSVVKCGSHGNRVCAQAIGGRQGRYTRRREAKFALAGIEPSHELGVSTNVIFALGWIRAASGHVLGANEI
eukprot:4534833-Pleurochrysis_carterae.AAC.1